jgi:YVTN family beta-propeller protein
VVYVTNQYANSISVYNLSTGVMTHSIKGFAAPTSAAVTPNGSQLYVTNANSATLAAVDTADLRITAKVLVGLLPTAVAISPNGATAYVTNAFGYSLSEVNTATNTLILTLPEIGIYPVSIAF